MAKSKETLEEIRKRYGLSGTAKPTSTQKPASTQSENTKQNNSSASSFEELRKKYALGSSKTTHDIYKSSNKTSTKENSKGINPNSISKDSWVAREALGLDSSRKTASDVHEPKNGESLYSGTVKYLQDNYGLKNASGIMTQREWQRYNDKGTYGKTYEEYLAGEVAKHDKGYKDRVQEIINPAPTTKIDLTTHKLFDNPIKHVQEADENSPYNVKSYDVLMARTTAKDDFKQNSKYSPIKPKTDAELEAEGYKKAQDGSPYWYKMNLGGTFTRYYGEDSKEYTYINDPSKREAIDDEHRQLSGIKGYEERGLGTLTEEEKAVYNYLYHQDRQNGTNKADEYLDAMGKLLQQRAQYNEMLRLKGLAEEYPFTTSVYSFGTNLADAYLFPTKLLATTSGTYEENEALLNKWGNETSTIRGTVSKDMPWLGRMLYGAGMSIGDQVTAYAAGGGSTGLFRIIMGSSVGSSVLSQEKAKGASDGRALTMALSMSALSWAVEKIGVEALLSEPKSLLGYWAKVGAAESLEEGIENVGGDVLDGVVSAIEGNKNYIEKRIDYLVQNEGYTEEDAFLKAMMEDATDIGEDMFVGFLAGGGMAGGRVAPNIAMKGIDAIVNPIDPTKYPISTPENPTIEAEAIQKEAEANEAAYNAGKLNVPREKANLTTPAQEAAYNEGRKEYIKNMPSDEAETPVKINKDDFAVIDIYDTEYSSYGVRLYPKKTVTDAELSALRGELRKRVNNNRFRVVVVDYDGDPYIEITASHPTLLDEDSLFDDALTNELDNEAESAETGKPVTESKTTPNYEALQAMSEANEPITADEVRRTTMYGEEGSKLVADIANKEGVTLDQAKRMVDTAYLAGASGLDRNKATFFTDTQRLAFEAGANDRQAQNKAKQEQAKNATVYETGFTENEYSKQLNSDEREMFTSIARDLKMDIEFIDEIIAYYDNGNPIEANASHEDGEMRVSSTSKLKLAPVAIHEAFHRMRQLDPEGTDALMNFLYESSEQTERGMKLGGVGVSLFEEMSKSYSNVKGMNTIGVIEEVAAERLQTLLPNAKAFNQWRASIDANPQMKTRWQKFLETIKQVFEDLWAAITNSKMSLEAKRKAQAEIEQIKSMLTDAYKGAMQKAEERSQSGTAQNSKSVKGEFSLKDSDYQQAVENGDMETAQRMVDEAAKESGFPTKVYHGTAMFGFTRTDLSKSDDGISFFATDSLELAQTYSGVDGETSIKKGNVNNQVNQQRYEGLVTSFVDKVNEIAGRDVLKTNDTQFEKLVNKVKKGKSSLTMHKSVSASE